MSPDSLFVTASVLTWPAWLALVFAPHARWTQRLVHRGWVSGVLALAYFALLFLRPSPPEGGDLRSAHGLALLLSTPDAALLAWLHFLGFDLLAGAWMVRDARRRGLAHGWAVPGLILAFLVGPVGLLSHLLLRSCARKSSSLHPA